MKQRAYINELRAKLKSMNDKSKTIRYINDTLRIVVNNRRDPKG